MISKWSAAALVVMSVGCAKTESNDLLTSGIYASLEARAIGDGKTTVYATLYVDNPTTLNFVELTGDDKLEASSGASSQVMVQSELGNIVSHAAVFTGDTGGTEFEVAFDRTVDQGAPSSTMSLPLPFTLDPAPASQSRAAAITLTWAPEDTGDAMLWLAAGDCIAQTSGSVGGDTGSLTLPAGTFVKAAGTGVADSCTLTFTLARHRTGTLDSHYGKGGDIFGSQERTLTWTTTP